MYWLNCNRCDRSKACDSYDLCEDCRHDERLAARQGRADLIRRVVAPDLGRARVPVSIAAALGLVAGVLSTFVGMPYLQALVTIITSATIVFSVVMAVRELVVL